jgi:hypothetical protein
MQNTNEIVFSLRAIDPTFTIGTALCTATGYTVHSYDGTTATLHGGGHEIADHGGPYIDATRWGTYWRVEFDIQALPKCDAVRGIAVFPTDSIRRVGTHSWQHSDPWGGY